MTSNTEDVLADRHKNRTAKYSVYITSQQHTLLEKNRFGYNLTFYHAEYLASGDIFFSMYVA